MLSTFSYPLADPGIGLLSGEYTTEGIRRF
jgi:hypothetical protein